MPRPTESSSAARNLAARRNERMGRINLTREEAETSAATASRLEAAEHDARLALISPDTCPHCYHARMDKLRSSYAESPMSDAAMEIIRDMTFCPFHAR